MKTLLTRAEQQEAILLLDEIQTWLEKLGYKAPELIRLEVPGLIRSIERLIHA